jgi:membrane fusion protein, multidrug efflux system
MKHAAILLPRGPVIRNIALGVGFGLCIVLLLLWLAGVFSPKIRRPSGGEEGYASRPVRGETLEAVRLIELPVEEGAVGTTRAVHETTIASKLLAKVIEVDVKAGQAVHTGDVLVRLDDADLQARLDQAKASVQAAEAARDLAKIENDRVTGLYSQNAAAKIELDQAESALRSAAAELDRARQAEREVTVTLSYATITCPLDGVVVDKRVEVGDTVSPGQTLLTMYDPSHMQLVASVRESLVRRLRLGQKLGVRIDALTRTCEGEVSEIVPESDVASRSFIVKVIGPCPPDIHPGMFGRLLIPLNEEKVLVIPQAAVRHVGQLSTVDVADAEGKTLHRRVVQVGRSIGADVEVLAGVQEGERVAVPQPGAGGDERRG